MSETQKHFELAVLLSRDALKALLIVNGGAATALIALMGKSGIDYTCAILLFASGAVGAVISGCFAYFSQLSYANHLFDTEKYQHKTHLRWQYTTLAVVLITLACMISGIVAAAHAARL